MERKWKSEIIRWAKAPEGTKVWCHEKGNVKDWELLCCSPEWHPNKKYIVDDEWSELRKAQINGKQLQCLDWKVDGYSNETLDTHSMTLTNVEDWRIRPEPVYEWQYVYEVSVGINKYGLTEHRTDEEASGQSGKYSKFEDSKRLCK